MFKKFIILAFFPIIVFGQKFDGFKYVYVPKLQYANGQTDIWNISARTVNFFYKSGFKVLSSKNEVQKIKNLCELLTLNIEHTNVVSGKNHIYYKLYDCNRNLIHQFSGSGISLTVEMDFQNATRKAFKSLNPLVENYSFNPDLTPENKNIIKEDGIDLTSEDSIRNYFDKNGSEYLEGIWDYSGVNGYRLAVIKDGYKYRATIIGFAGNYRPGEFKASIETASSEEVVTIDWLMGDKVNKVKTVGIVKNNSLIEFSLPGEKVFLYKTYPKSGKIKKTVKSNEWAGNGSGIIISKSGYIITNHHVIEDADEIEVEFILNDEVQKFNAEIVQVDKTNDLAIVKIVDVNFDGIEKLPYNFKTRTSDVGTKVYAYGYPMALSIMGKEIKVTDGMISSKTGFDGDITTYQITAPIQGGNSGGPLFDENGNLIGINSSGLRRDLADNVAYSIKSSYVLNLIDILPKSIELPSNTSLKSLPLTEQIKEISKCVVLIKIK